MQFILWTGLFGTGVGLSSLAALLRRESPSLPIIFINAKSEEIIV